MLFEVLPAQDDAKPVALVRAAAQLLRMPRDLENADAFNVASRPVGLVPARHTEPLPGYGLPVFQPGVPCVFRRHARMTRKLSRHPLGVGAGLLDPQVVVFAVAGQVPAQDFGDVEVCRRTAHTCCEQRRPVRTGPVRQSHVQETLAPDVGDRHDLVEGL